MTIPIFQILLICLSVPPVPLDTIPPAALSRLVRAYPDHLWKAEGNYLIWKDSTAMLFDDGLLKTEQSYFDSADLEDQLHYLPYPIGPIPDTPSYGCNPGTYRCAAFFQKMYGSTEAQVRKNLTIVKWPNKINGQNLVVTKINNVDKHLIAVAEELNARPELKKYITNIGGGFNWRFISGTQKPSPHSYGIAIDINVKNAHYWQWDYPKYTDQAVEQNIRWRNTIPWEIVQIFENHGFIWGGKWYHYDTMHFEYRPELILK